MTDSTSKEKNNGIWRRLLFMILYVLIFGIVEMVVYITALVAFVTVILKGTVDTRVLNFGQQVGGYLKQIVSYLTFNSEERPFPFGSWPEISDRNDSEQTQESSIQTENNNSSQINKAIESESETNTEK